MAQILLVQRTSRVKARPVLIVVHRIRESIISAHLVTKLSSFILSQRCSRSLLLCEFLILLAHLLDVLVGSRVEHFDVGISLVPVIDHALQHMVII